MPTEVLFPGFTEVSDEEVARAQWLLNNRPRKVLDWKFPSEGQYYEGAMRLVKQTAF